MSLKYMEKSDLTLKQQSELVVEVFQGSLNTLKDHGLDEISCLNGILSQIAILVEPEALNHALELNKKNRPVFLSLGH